MSKLTNYLYMGWFSLVKSIFLHYYLPRRSNQIFRYGDVLSSEPNQTMCSSSYIPIISLFLFFSYFVLHSKLFVIVEQLDHLEFSEVHVFYGKFYGSYNFS